MSIQPLSQLNPSNSPNTSVFLPKEELYDDYCAFYEKRTRLHDAAKRGDISEVEKLIKRGFDINAVDTSGNTPLYRAATYGKLDCFETLLRHGGNIHIKTASNYSLLHTFKYKEDVTSIIPSLVDQGLEINEADEYGMTPFHFACYGKQVNVELLIQLGAEILVKDNRCRTALHLAAGGNEELVPFLLRTDLVKLINEKDNEGDTALHSAFSYKKINPILVLVQAGADINAQNKQGQTILHLAASWIEEYRTASWNNDKDNFEFLQKLIDAGADKNLTDKNGKKPCDLTDNSNLKSLLS